MQRDELTPALVRRAVRIYMELAWPDASAAHPVFEPRRLESATSIDELFALCTGPPKGDAGPLLDRYTLRLGNARYPFMKFVVQEYLLDEQYFFSVDTHDDLDIRPDNPDYAGWLEIKRHNRELKQAIESAWAEAGLPTHGELRRLAVGIAAKEHGEPERGRILLADDEEDVARGLEALLEARGYRVEVVVDGRAALARLARDPLPDLVLLDFGMPELDGAQVLERMRADPRTRDVPVLLATASSIDLERMGRVRGLLRKPYPREVLFALLEKILVPHRAGEPRAW